MGAGREHEGTGVPLRRGWVAAERSVAYRVITYRRLQRAWSGSHPHAQRLVERRGHEQLAVGVERQPLHEVLVPAERAHLREK
jgi:hypothetical protein